MARSVNLQVINSHVHAGCAISCIIHRPLLDDCVVYYSKARENKVIAYSQGKIRSCFKKGSTPHPGMYQGNQIAMPLFLFFMLARTKSKYCSLLQHATNVGYYVQT